MTRVLLDQVLRTCLPTDPYTINPLASIDQDLRHDSIAYQHMQGVLGESWESSKPETLTAITSMLVVAIPAMARTCERLHPVPHNYTLYAPWYEVAQSKTQQIVSRVQ